MKIDKPEEQQHNVQYTVPSQGHRVILAAQSDFFRQLILDALKERNEQNTEMRH